MVIFDVHLFDQRKLSACGELRQYEALGSFDIHLQQIDWIGDKWGEALRQHACWLSGLALDKGTHHQRAGFICAAIKSDLTIFAAQCQII